MHRIWQDRRSRCAANKLISVGFGPYFTDLLTHMVRIDKPILPQANQFRPKGAFMHCPTLEMTSNRCIQDGAAPESASEVNIQASASGAETTTLTVNGESRVLSLPGSTSLLDVLRNALSLQGSRFGCGGGHCGACKVLLDGRAVPSCTTPLWAAADKSVVTIEGLGTADEPHPLQSAFIDHQAGQCGYCLSGILMTAAALLVGNPCPSEAEIRRALDEHLCRCGAHNRIVLAILGARTSAP